jgi:hypothetical protein
MLQPQGSVGHHAIERGGVWESPAGHAFVETDGSQPTDAWPLQNAG